MTEPDTTPAQPLVLIANDQEWSARSLESILAPNGYSVVRAHTGREAIELAQRVQPDLVILDAQLPDVHGFDVCADLRQNPQFGPSLPIIITTSGPSGRAQRLEAYRCGAWEFLGQPLDGEALLIRLRTFIQSKVEVDRLREESLVDLTSGFYNMRGLARRAREIGAEAQRRHQPLACVVFAPTFNTDLDEEALEAIAVQVAQRLRQAGRLSDAIGRLGGLEYAVIAPATDENGAKRMVERFESSLDSTTIDIDGESIPLKLSAGYCAVGDFSESKADAVELLLRATTALRELRKEGGAARVKSFAANN